ncbi:hypothetical protein PIB30_038173 [Stylosanthes scabra]|uniref:Uncharacterized protein n=1 Tax=Stylosanthes scabra TaxID=79078 RepID=A0ABU6YB99_9FABA|nr:hypothetical protein [Stylosanthes scabra]
MRRIPSELRSYACLGESSTRISDLLGSPRVAPLFLPVLPAALGCAAPSSWKLISGGSGIRNHLLSGVKSKVIEERLFPHSIVTYSLDAGNWHEAGVLEEAK